MVAKKKDIELDVENVLLEGEKEEMKEKDEEDEKEEESDGVPQDRGWSWVIAVCMLLNTTIIIGFNRTLSVLFIDIRDAFQESSSTITLMFTIHALSASVSSVVVSNIFMKKVSVRFITVFAAILNATTTVFVSHVHNIVLFLLLFIFKGLSFGALLVCPMSMIGYYFKKRRALASSIGGSGFCVAFIVFPPAADALRQEFGFRGALLIVAAVELHLVAVNLLLRPVESYKKLHAKKLRLKKQEEMKLKQLTPIYKGPSTGTALSSPINGTTRGEGVNRNETEYYDKVNGNGEHHQVKEAKLLLGDTTDFVKDVEPDDGMRLRSNSESRFIVRSGKNREHCNVEIPCGSPPVFASLKDISHIDRHPYSHSVVEKDSLVEKGREKPSYASQLSAVSSAELPINPELLMTSDRGTDANDESDITSVKGKEKRTSWIETFIDVSLFQNWLFVMIIIFVPLGASTQYLIIYMPAIATSSGVSKGDAALLMTIGGVMDLLTRIVSGYLGDFAWVSKPKLVAFSTLVITLVCQFSRFFTSYTLFIVFAMLVGMFGGIRQNFLNVLLIEYVGVEKVAKAFGLCAMCATLCLSINHPVIGAMFDATGDFVLPLHYVGVLVFIGTVVLACEPLFKKLQDKKIAQANQTQ